MADARVDRPGPGPGTAAETLTVDPQYFAPVPERVIDAEISDGAFRCTRCCALRRQQRERMPSRAALARRLRRSSDG